MGKKEVGAQTEKTGRDSLRFLKPTVDPPTSIEDHETDKTKRDSLVFPKRTASQTTTSDSYASLQAFRVIYITASTDVDIETAPEQTTTTKETQ
jgi:hypothetical protein